jgi:hypothetical protein
MKTPGLITLLLFLGAPLFAQEPASQPPAASAPAAEMDAQEQAAIVDMLTSAPWKFSGTNWTLVRIFDKDGTFRTLSARRQTGHWQIAGGSVVLTYNMDGHKDTLTLPLNPKGTPGTGRSGTPTTAILLPDAPEAAQLVIVGSDTPPTDTAPEDTAPGKPAPPELLKLRQGYIDSLNDLLQGYIKADNTAGIKAVTDDIDKLTPCGVWRWVGGKIKTATIHPDGTVTENTKTEDKTSKDAWHWTDEINGKFQITWDSGWVDDLTLSPDGKTMLILNNLGQQHIVQRLPQVAEGAAEAGAAPTADTSH